MQKLRRRRIGEILVAENLITQAQLDGALAVQKETGEAVGEILLRESLVTESDITRTICMQYQLPYLNPRNYDIDEELVRSGDSTFLYTSSVLPLGKIGETTIAALGEIPDENTEQDIVSALGNDLYFYFAPQTEIDAHLKNIFQMTQDDVVALSERRRRQHGPSNAVAASVQDQLLETLDSSWESIFDEAEQNL